MTNIAACVVRVPKATYHVQGGNSAGDLGMLVDQANSYMGRLVNSQGLRIVVAP